MELLVMPAEYKQAIHLGSSLVWMCTNTYSQQQSSRKKHEHCWIATCLFASVRQWRLGTLDTCSIETCHSSQPKTSAMHNTLNGALQCVKYQARLRQGAETNKLHCHLHLHIISVYKCRPRTTEGCRKLHWSSLVSDQTHATAHVSVCIPG